MSEMDTLGVQGKHEQKNKKQEQEEEKQDQEEEKHEQKEGKHEQKDETNNGNVADEGQ